jgi:hypothetical protein
VRILRLTSLRAKAEAEPASADATVKRTTRAGALALAGFVTLALAASACHLKPPVSTPSASPARQNRPPSVHARCEPCAVQMGKTVTVGASAQDPDGDSLTYAWTTPGGTLASPSGAETQWTAPAQEGPVPVTITVQDGKGGTATDAITIQVTKG